MQFTAQLDVDVVALEAEDEVTCLVSLTAPAPEEIADRPGETLIAVVDRSGSMDGGPIEAVRTALHQLVDRLKPQDRCPDCFHSPQDQMGNKGQPRRPRGSGRRGCRHDSVSPLIRL
jgi:hypothetical protein